MKSAKIFLIPLSLLVLLVFTYPFPLVVASENLSLQGLSGAQKTNLQIAVKSLNGFVLKPGQVFSFNNIIGPRESYRGYKDAPAYLENGSLKVLGGGICLLSSGLYKLALQNDLEVIERKPHLKTVHSVLPGLDATVWYNSIDLKFKNIYKFPLQIKANIEKHNLKLSLRAHFWLKRKNILRRLKKTKNQKLQVEVYSNSKLISRDFYNK